MTPNDRDPGTGITASLATFDAKASPVHAKASGEPNGPQLPDPIPEAVTEPHSGSGLQGLVP